MPEAAAPAQTPPRRRRRPLRARCRMPPPLARSSPPGLPSLRTRLAPPLPPPTDPPSLQPPPRHARRPRNSSWARRRRPNAAFAGRNDVWCLVVAAAADAPSRLTAGTDPDSTPHPARTRGPVGQPTRRLNPRAPARCPPAPRAERMDGRRAASGRRKRYAAAREGCRVRAGACYFRRAGSTAPRRRARLGRSCPSLSRSRTRPRRLPTGQARPPHRFRHRRANLEHAERLAPRAAARCEAPQHPPPPAPCAGRGARPLCPGSHTEGRSSGPARRRSGVGPRAVVRRCRSRPQPRRSCPSRRRRRPSMAGAPRRARPQATCPVRVAG
eukprot:scaffold9802_cov100-Isochrysis_galbana.AAC.2